MAEEDNLTPEESKKLQDYRESLKQEWELADPSKNLVAAAKLARANLLKLTPDAIAALKGILASTDNEKTRLETAKFIISLTIGEKAKVVMPKGLQSEAGMDELELLFAELGAQGEEIPKLGDV